MVAAMAKKRGAAAKGVTLSKSNIKANVNAYDKLPSNPTEKELDSAAASVALADLEQRVADVRDSWETDSLFEDVLEELTTATTTTSSEASTPDETCTPEEAARLRRELREYGPAVFCQRTVDAGRYTARKLLSAFNVRAPTFLEGQPDEDYFSLLSLAMTRELSKRAKLMRYNSVDDAVRLVEKSSNIILLTGAGISTSLGIPDFRSQGTGLYSKLEHLGLNDPQEVFDIDVFKQDPSIFYSVAKDIIPDTERFTPTHKFIAMLHEHGKLLTNYSQNIDNLEVKAGVPRDRLIQCHGSFGTATCIQCGHQISGERIFPDIKAGNIPRCPRCLAALRASRTSNGAVKRKRSGGVDGKKKPRRRWGASNSFSSDEEDDNSSDYDIPTAGVMKPDITFFGEALPDAFSKRLVENDRDRVDLVIVIGTSLKVTPVSEIVSWLPPNVPQIYVSRQAVNHINFDIDLLGDCDVVVAELCRRLGWPMRHEMVPTDQRVSVTPSDDGSKSRHVFTVAEP